jgi:alpha-galactosidase
MTRLESWGTVDVEVVLEIGERVLVRYFGPRDADRRLTPASAAVGPVELLVSGDALPQGSRHILLGTSLALRYESHRITEDDRSSHLELTQVCAAGTLRVISRWSIEKATPVLTASTTVRNASDAAVTLEFVSSFVVNGLATFDDPDWRRAVTVGIPHNTLYGEFQWRTSTLPELGLSDVGFTSESVQSSKKRIALTASGTQPSTEYLPAGVLSDRTSGNSWGWQIEHNGAWHWEIGDNLASIYLCVSGPSDAEHHWHRTLRPGDEFTTVPVAIAAVQGGADEVFDALTVHRRAIRRPNDDNVSLPVVFNDFMNCLNADPTEDRLIPLIDAAAAVGCEIYCIDAGWYSDDRGWWTTVGGWEESAERFPNGLLATMDRIRAHGMIPGLWIEPEVIGVDSPLVHELPDDAFFWRHGRRVNSQGRHQLDFRSPAVVERMTGVIDRLVADYGVGYLKFDYNINGGVGSDLHDESAGDALLEHNRAFLHWIDGLFLRHPDLVIESCASGGARVDYATLSRMSIVSTSDQTDPVRYVPIAASQPSAVAPEQAAVWVYPEPEFDDELNALCVLNGMLGRPQVSGGLADLSESQKGLVREGLLTYKALRSQLPRALPFWPLGLPTWDADWAALGVRTEHSTWVCVWRRGGDTSVTLDLPHLQGMTATAEVEFPRTLGGDLSWNDASGRLTVQLPAAPSARLILLTPHGNTSKGDAAWTI